MHWAPLILAYSILLSDSTRAVTIYGQEPLGATSTAPGAKYTGLKAYDPTVLNPPPIPNPAPASQYTLQLIQNANGVQGLSVPTIYGSFLGFSIEVSVVNQVCKFYWFIASWQPLTSLLVGKNSSFVQVPFLNLMSSLAERAGEVHIRIGGNTQDYGKFN